MCELCLKIFFFPGDWVRGIRGISNGDSLGAIKLHKFHIELDSFNNLYEIDNKPKLLKTYFQSQQRLHNI